MCTGYIKLRPCCIDKAIAKFIDVSRLKFDIAVKTENLKLNYLL